MGIITVFVMVSGLLFRSLQVGTLVMQVNSNNLYSMPPAVVGLSQTKLFNVPPGRHELLLNCHTLPASQILWKLCYAPVICIAGTQRG